MLGPLIFPVSTPRCWEHGFNNFFIPAFCPYLNFDWLILAQSEQLAVRHQDVVLAHMKELGLRLNAKKSVLPPVQRTTCLGVVWDSTLMQACRSPACIESILATVNRVREGQYLTIKTLAVVAKDHRVFPEGQPISHDQSYAAMLTCLRHVEETVDLTSSNSR